MTSRVPDLRRVARGDQRPDGRWVLYWMTSARRTRANHALDRAMERARELSRPLIVVEPLSCDHRWASPRFHRFVLDGLADNARAFASAGVAYHPFVETEEGACRALLRRLADDACAVVVDEWPDASQAWARQPTPDDVGVAVESVDSNGLLPLRASERPFARAYDFRRFVQRELPAQLGQTALREPLRGAGRLPPARIPDDVLKRWPAAPLAPEAYDLSALPLDHGVTPVELRGGSRDARRSLRRFVAQTLDSYDARRSHADDAATSGLSPYLHFGHIGAQEVFDAVAAVEDWSPERLAPKATGSRTGWWGLSDSAEAFLDQLITWRELGGHHAFHRPDHKEYASLPDWARKTLAEHASDPRPHLYTRDEFEAAATHDPLWNAAQRELLGSGVIHNALRMLWGKKILEWSASPEEAWETLFALNDRWALDGRDPNSASGIGWTLGRFDRAWGPERPVFGKVRCMTSASSRRKWRLKGWLERWSDSAATPAPESLDGDRAVRNL